MSSPLAIEPHTAAQLRDLATQRFYRAHADAAIAAWGCLGVLAVAIVLASVVGPSLYVLVVLGAAIGLVAITRKRANGLERRMWWHQARAGLVDELAQQRKRDVAIIDLRESTTAGLPENESDASRST